MTASGRACTVLDASALVEVLLRSDKGRWFRQRLDWTEAFHAPELLVVEAAAVSRRYELRGEITAKRAEKAFDLMVAMPLSLVSTSDLLPEAWRLRHHITVSDACYVVLTVLSLVPDVIVDATPATKALLMLTHLVAAAIVIPAVARRLA